MKNCVMATALLAMAGATFAQTAQSPEDEAALQQLRAFTQQRGMQMTPEQEQRFLQMQRQQRERFKMIGLLPMGQPEAAAPVNTSPAPVQTEDGLRAAVAALPTRPEPFVIEDRKDGFIINGRGFVDPEGQIRNYAISPVSGLVTYLADTGNGSFLIKTARAGTSSEPVTIARATRSNSGWQVDTSTGKRIAGQSLTMLSGGFLVGRDTAAFVYAPGQGVRSIAVPNGFVVANFQRGDVQSTGYLLIERDVATAQRENGLFESVKALGAAIGVNAAEDYALLNISSGETTKINIAEGGKRVGNYSNCRRRNAIVNECANVDFRETLYDSIGRNLAHYYWRINWFGTPGGPVLVAQENGLKDITVTNLKTGKKALAFTRALGIAGHDATQDSSGKISIQAKMGFSTERIDDASSFLASAPDMRQARTQ
ncbi:MAG: hypothetical protein HGA47_01385 [Zoogloea sp.]|nr:hypothetical protein [Zoogloea sp.]